MAEVAKTSENGKPKSPPAAAQTCWRLQRDADDRSRIVGRRHSFVVVGKSLQCSSGHPASRFISTSC